MKTNLYKKAAAGLAALIMLSACGSGAEVPVETDSEPTNTVLEQEKDESEETSVTTADSFGDDLYEAQTTVSHNVKLNGGEELSNENAETVSLVTAASPGRTEEEAPATLSTTALNTGTASKKDTSKASEKGSSSEKSVQKDDDVSASSDDVKVVISEAGGWNDGTADFKQYTIKVQNKGKKYVSSWKVTVPFGSSAAIDQSWSAEISMNGGTLTASNVDWNASIEPGKEAEFGVIIKNPGSPDKNGTKVSCTLGDAPSWANSNNGGGSGTPVTTPAKEVPPPTTDDWLYTSGSKIVDKDGKEVWLTGVNWFGYNTGTNTFDGLWACDLNTSLSEIADHGFNLLRVPFSAELINKWAAGEYPEANYNHAYNSYLEQMNSLEIFDYVVGQCRANGLKIMIDIHSAKTDASGHMKNMWYEGDVTEQDYINALKWIAKRYKNDDTIIAYDLKNEPHGKANESPRAKWDNTYDPDNWRYEAEKAANAVLSQNPNVLIMLVGIEIYPKDVKSGFSSRSPEDYHYTWWGANLRGVKDYPVDLGKHKNKLVYSPHDYGPSVYEQEWFKGNYSYESLKKDAWNDNWLYIYDSKTAPLLIGEWGGFMNESNLKWMKALRKLIKENRLHHTFWCFNANSGDTGGLVKDDFVTWDEEKYKFVKDVLWQKDGKFVGLDHEIPLGENGMSLDEAF